MSSWDGWEYDVLTGLITHTGTISPASVQVIRSWHACEGGSASFNPLNTTQPWPGATDYNAVGVKNYPSRYAGLHATLKTLTNGHYNGIVADLTTGTKEAHRIVSDNAGEFSTWGTTVACILAALPGQNPVGSPSYAPPGPGEIAPDDPSVKTSRLPSAWNHLTYKIAVTVPTDARRARVIANAYRRIVRL